MAFMPTVESATQVTVSSILGSPVLFARRPLPCGPAQRQHDAWSYDRKPADIVRGGYERPFAADFYPPAQQKAGKPARAFDLPKDGFGDRFAQSVHRSAGFRPQLALHPLLHRESGGDPAARGRWDGVRVLDFLGQI